MNDNPLDSPVIEFRRRRRRRRRRSNLSTARHRKRAALFRPMNYSAVHLRALNFRSFPYARVSRLVSRVAFARLDFLTFCAHELRAYDTRKPGTMVKN